MKKLLLFVCLICYQWLTAQSPKYRVLTVPVIQHGTPVREPWTGGMDSPQFSAIDLNDDGIKDLFVFDRVGDRVLTYISNGDGSDTMYKYAPQYESLFPSGMQHWAQLIDYNNDGIPDLFTFTEGPNYPGISVYKGSIQGGQLKYDLVQPYLVYADTPYPATPIFTNLLDIPAIVDVNGDGYLDVLVYNKYGSTIGYYENQTGIGGGTGAYDIDSFAYEQSSICWGNISQNLNTNSITINISCKGGNDDASDTSDPKDLRHSGNSLYPLKDPVYKDVDLLNGNIGYSNLFLLRNCGGTSMANVCEYDSIFLDCNVPVIMPTYPASFGINVNNDAITDLLVSPNVEGPYTVGAGAARNVKNVMYYQGTGDTSCWYAYQSDSFIVHHMLDFGSMSKGQFYDFDGDGLVDLIATSYGYYVPNENNLSTLAYYRNTGTATNPQFTLVSTDYDSLSQFQFFAFNPAFGDMDGDGHNDIVAGDIHGTIYFLKNTATSGSSFPSLTANWTTTMGIGGSKQFAAPLIYDVNGDSLNDLIVGWQDGTLTYFWNFGTKQNPMFSSDSSTAFFGNISVTQGGSTLGYSQPLIRVDSAGNQLLFVGSMTGGIHEYLIDPAKLRGGAFTQLDSNYMHVFTGFTSTISIADINNDGKMEYLLGTAAGGLLLYSDSLWDSSALPLAVQDIIPNRENMSIYPNPAKEYFTCNTPTGFVNPQVEILNVLGQSVPVEMSLNAGQIRIQTLNLSSGFYIVNVCDEGKTYRGKVIVDR